MSSHQQQHHHNHQQQPQEQGSDPNNPNNQFHILPIDNKQQDMPTQLTDKNGLTGQPAVFAQPGPVIIDGQTGTDLANAKVSSSEELDQRTAALNNNDNDNQSAASVPHKPKSP